ncbi:hypothetical protein OE88DRAFT_1493732 [Heliocybe sulcata]|uniref:Uncharacterized protein n=1 Tax=Heliocybe sulcata TaxID=5364 RepID=A0A5C3N2M3_9AGAM|nr:hypothetical protein OE88DRAFT_1493732 [Heliocybe sulcata]
MIICALRLKARSKFSVSVEKEEQSPEGTHQRVFDEYGSKSEIPQFRMLEPITDGKRATENCRTSLLRRGTP